MKDLAVFLPLLVMAVVSWGLVVVLKKVGQKYPPVSTDLQPAGVGGWLLFLIFALIFLGPLVGSGRMMSDLTQAEVLYPALPELDVWKTYKIVAWILQAIAVALSIYAGRLLLAKRSQDTKQKVIMLLWASGPVMALVAMIAPAFVMGMDAMPSFGEVAVPVLSASVSALVWTLYIKKSKRVRNTYGA